MKDMTVQELANRLECAIDWPRQAVGVRFLFSEDEFNNAKGIKLEKPISYCRMVKAATAGHAVKGDASTQGCIGGARLLGIEPPNEMHHNGRRALATQLYHDQPTAKFSRDRQTICNHKAYGVLVKALSEYNETEEPPHVVLIVTNPYYAMRIIQGYTYYYGIYNQFKMSGLGAVCGESTAYPYTSNAINLSMFCGGTRQVCKWDDNELLVSIPYSKFPLTVEGLLRTMNLIDNNEKKAVERLKLAERNMEDEFPLQDDFSYCTIVSTYN